jgi:hypothetical protein
MSENRKPFETFAHYKLGRGFATLAVSVDEGHTRVGVSYCHPRDGINKARGRDIAASRRDVGSDFSFEFIRNKDRLGNQLRAEFESFMSENRTVLLSLLSNGLEGERVGAPPWALHSFAREVKRRARITGVVTECSTPGFGCC